MQKIWNSVREEKGIIQTQTGKCGGELYEPRFGYKGGWVGKSH